MKRLAISIVLVIVSFITFLTSAFGWLASYSVIPATINGSVQTGYFGGGKGIKGEPYILSTPRHVYNLAWLQYTGYLNNTLNDDGSIKQAYFQVADDIDMGGLVIPPIGTREYPFVGNFNGNGKRIYNFHVANYVGGNGGITERPLSVADMGNDASIVGFFGVIGDFDGALKGKIVDDSGKETGEQVNAVYNLYLDNFSVSTLTTESLIGLLAGYVNGGVKNVGIGVDNEGYGATINVGAGTMPLSEATLGTVPESLSRVQTFNALSLFALLGEFDGANVTWENAPTESLGGDAGAEGQGFGGSIDMGSLVRRLTYMLSENQLRKGIMPEYQNPEEYPVKFTQSLEQDSQILDYKADDITASNSKLRIGYLGKGSIIPLNVNTEEMFNEEVNQESRITYQGTRYTTNYLTNKYYREHSVELTLASNTGYIIGGGGSGAWVRARIQGVKGSKGGIGTSITSGDTVVYDTATNTHNMKFYTVTPSGTNKEVEAGDGFIKYTEVTNSLAQSMSGKATMSGIRFEATATNGIQINKDGSVDAERITTADSVILNKQTKTNYQMLDGAINFQLSDSGYITAVAGTYYKLSPDIEEHSLFSLYKVTRNASNVITNVTKINNIYLNDADKKSVLYNQASKPDGYTLAFDSEVMNKLTTWSAAYYFEIPVEAGEYALGGAVGETAGAYLLYLDIGANGAIGDTGGDTQPGEGGPAYTIEGVNFVDKNPFTAEETDSVRTIDDKTEYPVITYRLALPKESTTHSGLHISFARTSARAMTHKLTDTTESQFEILHHTDDTGITFNTPNATANVRYVYKKQEETWAA